MRSHHSRTRSQISTASISRPISQQTEDDLLPYRFTHSQPPSSFSSPDRRTFDYPISIPESSFHDHPLESPAEDAFAFDDDRQEETRSCMRLSSLAEQGETGGHVELRSPPSPLSPLPQLHSTSTQPLPSSPKHRPPPLANLTSSNPPPPPQSSRPLSSPPPPPPPAPPAPLLNADGSEWKPARPTFRLLYKYCTARDLLLVIPATLISLCAGGIVPYMSQVVGDSFNSFAFYPLDTTTATEDQKSSLRHDIKIASLSLMAMGCGFIALHTLMTGLWVWVGERNIRTIRREVYRTVGAREMEWYDLGMGINDGGEEVDDDKEAGVGAAGLMSKFNRETDDVRFATSQAMGNVISDFAAVCACLGLAFSKSWSLTLVILSAIPVVVVAQGVIQGITFPLMAQERRIYAEASTKAERASASIATVKAFNAQEKETDDFSVLVEQGRKVEVKIAIMWGFSLGLSASVLSLMFVAGFWFGAKLVKQGKIQPGEVMTVFFATVLASNSVQTLMPILELINKGKGSMVSLQTLINPPPSASSASRRTSPPLSISSGSSTPRPFSSSTSKNDLFPGSPSMPFSPAPSYSPFAKARSRAIPSRIHATKRASVNLRPIRPTKCHGEFVLRNVDFAYPSRPHVPALSDVTVFLPAGETTFIVGGSGSGKSTISQLLLQLYQPGRGSITFDDQEIGLLDAEWMKEHIASVQQGCILFDMTVHENVALGLAGSKARRPQDVTREEVIAACTIALMHDFVKGLPDGYDTRLGNGGADLSGGQKQRIAIARAVLRDPTVLILDECTSALDAVSRVLVFEAVKRWRKNRTTICITHDLSQITSGDFVYLLRDGVVIEEGYRSDLVRAGGAFSIMAAEQTKEPLPEVEIDDGWDDGEEVLETLAAEASEPKMFGGFSLSVPGMARPTSMRPASFNRQSSQFSYFDILAGYGSGVEYEKRASFKPPTPSGLHAVDTSTSSLDKRASQLPSPTRPFTNRPRLSSYGSSGPNLLPPSPVTTADQRASWRNLALARTGTRSNPTTPTSPGFPLSLFTPPPVPKAPEIFVSESEDDSEFLADLKQRGDMTVKGRAALLYPGSRVKRDASPSDSKTSELGHIGINMMEKTAGGHVSAEEQLVKDPSIISVMRQWYPTVPNKHIMLLAFATALGHGIITPLWSNYLSLLMGLVASGGRDDAGLLRNSLKCIGLAIADGLCVGTSFIAFETVAYRWITNLREKCFKLIVSQDKEWFDRSENNTSTVVQNLIKDADDMGPIVSTIPGHCLTAVVMIGFGVIWAAILGWKLTLVGVAVIPVFGVAIGVQFMLLNNVELKNKRMREEVAKIFYESVSNVRAVRAMALESVFSEKFDIALAFAYTSGRQGAWIQGVGSGLMNGLVYFVEALLFHMIAVLMIQGSYTYARALQVFSLVVFSITFASQMLAFLPTVAKAKRAALDFSRLVALSNRVLSESLGAKLQPEISGDITYSNVGFAYPSRPDVPVLAGTSFTIHQGETVAIVGASGSGKSTIAALLQRLYTPTSGSITLGSVPLGDISTPWLRSHISIVSQTPALFDASITANILYGSDPSTPHSVVEDACKQAQIHEFILSLPLGYATPLGENASLISGGQAQRLQIARALVNPLTRIFVLDECTSALDGENAREVLECVMRVRGERTVVMVTHKVEAMRRCGRVVVLAAGDGGARVVEDGEVRELEGRRGGVFAELVRGGEFEGSG